MRLYFCGLPAVSPPCFALLTFECGVWLTVTKCAVSGSSSSSRAIYGFFNFKHFTFYIDCSHTALAWPAGKREPRK